ncbi:MAG: DUF805 domain-containing protein [Sulfitobacter sp.]
MKTFFSYFENFAFKALKFDDRASPLEYWCVMPVIWLLIIAMIPGDARTFWNFLLSREIPPLNPFYYESFMLFVVTLIPRLSLTVRRLHDSGKSGKWAKLPYISVVSGIYLSLGVLSAMASMGGGLGNSMTVFAIGISMVMGNAESAWSAIFASAAVLNAMGWDAIIAILSELSGPAQKIDIQQGIQAASRGAKTEPSLMLVMLIMVALPFVTAMLHLFFMISPSKPDYDRAGSAPMTMASLRQKGETSANPFAGYKYLYERSAEQDAAHKAAAKDEIKSLYQQRVLGLQQP